MSQALQGCLPTCNTEKRKTMKPEFVGHGSYYIGMMETYQIWLIIFFYYFVSSVNIIIVVLKINHTTPVTHCIVSSRRFIIHPDTFMYIYYIIKLGTCQFACLSLKPHSHYACAFASATTFASNCNIVSMGCCVKHKEPILCI